ncbi:hypothetical protein [Halorhabdus sp. CBA1104]|uniref:hypothetical protein n=1 Tax=Halorhabdus sp. CBA1104 TaxID=1380432 RepID=UPI0012B23058|nr:hypothetical protein [Halorhabdus sp. CBA1104]
MDRHKLILGGTAGVAGVLVFLGLFVFPLQYGPRESAVVAGLVVLAGLWELVLDDALVD